MSNVPYLPAQQVPPAPPPPPSTPAATAPVQGGVRVTAGELQSRPMTKADVDALKSKRSELSRQIESAQGRRDEAVTDLRSSPSGAARAGIEQRLIVLDERIVQLEQDIAANGRQLAAAPGALVAGTEREASTAQRYGPFSSGQLTGMSIVSIVFIWGPLAWAAARMMLRRAAVPRPTPQLLESTARLERMEQAVDSIAIEIERISEGQRFVTQLMAKRAEPAALGVGQAPAEPIVAAQPEQVSFERR